MTARECSHCRKIVFFDPRMGDFVHDCGDFPVSTARGTEDVPVMGNWSDYTGSNTDSTLQANVRNQGTAASNFGTRGCSLGHKNYDRTVHGNRSSTHRTRSHLQYFSDDNR